MKDSFQQQVPTFNYLTTSLKSTAAVLVHRLTIGGMYSIKLQLNCTSGVSSTANIVQWKSGRQVPRVNSNPEASSIGCKATEHSIYVPYN